MKKIDIDELTGCIGLVTAILLPWIGVFGLMVALLLLGCDNEVKPYFTPYEGRALVSALCMDSTSEFIAIAPEATIDNAEIGYILNGTASDTFLLDGVLINGVYDALRDRLERDGLEVSDPCDESIQVGTQVSTSGQCGYDGVLVGHYWIIIGDGEDYWGLLVNGVENN